VYWEDTDAGGIVFYANYLKYMERARTEYLRSMGLSQQLLREQTGGIFVVVSLELRYRQPARLDDELLVTAALQKQGRCGMEMVQTVLLFQPEMALADMSVLCSGTVRLGWVDAKTMRSARIPPALVTALQ
jgi:acyl-CoA thioester hydrolase